MSETNPENKIVSCPICGGTGDLYKKYADTVRNQAGRIKALERVIRGMWPMWNAAMEWGERERAAYLDRMRNYHKDNPMTDDDMKLMLEVVTRPHMEIALRKRRWIPCAERLPNEEKYYLVSGNFGNFKVGILRFDGKNWETFRGSPDAWQPLPEPYQELQ